MRLTDMFLAFPSLILAMAISAILRPSLTNALIAIAVTSWPTYATVGPAQVLSLRARDFVEAARAEGAPDIMIILRHLIPNALAPLFVQATLERRQRSSSSQRACRSSASAPSRRRRNGASWCRGRRSS